MSERALPKHAHWCVTDDHAVVLDLRREKYFGIEASRISSAENAPTVYPDPETPLIEGYQEERESISARDVLRFLQASLASSLLLRFRRFENIVQRLERRKRCRAVRADLERARAVVAKFLRLRPLLFSTNEACLRDSLALLEFLAAYGVAAAWMIGVRTRPFVAHSWVQQGSVVFNDTPEHVRRYKPILAV
jgi:transglutaminase superfamily protein